VAYLAAGGAPALAHDDNDQEAVERADNYLRLQSTGQGLLQFVHMGADYHGHSYLHTNYVIDGDGYRVPGHFALVFRFHWEDDSITDLAFLCNEKGIIYDVAVNYTNARFNQPFLLANAAIQILGNLVIDNYKRQMSAQQLKLTHELVNNADAKGLLVLALILGENSRNYGSLLEKH
jgi:hypothetical protein